jgi:hypothetical protein
MMASSVIASGTIHRSEMRTPDDLSPGLPEAWRVDFGAHARETCQRACLFKVKRSSKALADTTMMRTMLVSRRRAASGMGWPLRVGHRRPVQFSLMATPVETS